MTNKTIDNFMTVKEAAWRWGVEYRALRERLNTKRRPDAIKEELEKGLLKYFKAPDAKYGDWIIMRWMLRIYKKPKEWQRMEWRTHKKTLQSSKTMKLLQLLIGAQFQQAMKMKC